MAEQLGSAYRRSISVTNGKCYRIDIFLIIIINCVRFFGGLKGHNDLNQYLSFTPIIMLT